MTESTKNTSILHQMFEMLSNYKDPIFTIPETMGLLVFVGGVYACIGYVLAGNPSVLPASIAFGIGGFLFFKMAPNPSQTKS